MATAILFCLFGHVYTQPESLYCYLKSAVNAMGPPVLFTSGVHVLRVLAVLRVRLSEIAVLRLRVPCLPTSESRKNVSVIASRF